MKTTILTVIASLIVSIGLGQEWFTSFDVAKRLAFVQNKMLFVILEESFDEAIPLLYYDNDGELRVTDLSIDNSLDSIIWENFVPVKLSESKHADFIVDAKGRDDKYINKLNESGVKIMDINGNILNIDDSSEGLMKIASLINKNAYRMDINGDKLNLNNTSNQSIDLYLLINKYSVNTSFLSSELENYSKERNLITAFRLASKYIDFAIFVDEKLRPEIITLANIYLDETKDFLLERNLENNEAYFQKIDLLQIKELLILNQTKNAYRKIKKINPSKLDTFNLSLFTFLNYTVFKLLKDEENANLWKSKISLLDLKKAELILKNNLNTIGNSD
jgi:hypothetical protein